MLEKKLYTDQKDIKEDVATLLVDAFPEDERPPVPYFFKSLERKGNNIYTYYLNDEFIGFTYVTLYEDVCYLFFLAVSENKRHQVFGGQILEDIKKRDYQDMNREHSPLRKADDAVEIDTSDLTIDEVVDAVMKIIQEKVGE